MIRFRKQLIAAVVFVLLGMVGTMMNSHKAAAAGSAPVTVMNTSSNPVVTASEGTTTVSGTVAVSNFPATQAVTGTVGVNNYPATQNVSGTVSVGNFPGTQNVNVTNATPLAVAAVDNPAFQPYSDQCTFDITSSILGTGVCTLKSVPAGKRLVIEMVSGFVQISTGTKPASLSLNYCVSGSPMLVFYFPSAFQASFSGLDGYVAGQQVRLYADNTCTPAFYISANGLGYNESTTLSLSGYLVNKP